MRCRYGKDLGLRFIVDDLIHHNVGFGSGVDRQASHQHIRQRIASDDLDQFIGGIDFTLIGIDPPQVGRHEVGRRAISWLG